MKRAATRPPVYHFFASLPLPPSPGLGGGLLGGGGPAGGGCPGPRAPCGRRWWRDVEPGCGGGCMRCCCGGGPGGGPGGGCTCAAAAVEAAAVAHLRRCRTNMLAVAAADHLADDLAGHLADHLGESARAARPVAVAVRWRLWWLHLPLLRRWRRRRLLHLRRSCRTTSGCCGGGPLGWPLGWPLAGHPADRRVSRGVPRAGQEALRAAVLLPEASLSEVLCPEPRAAESHPLVPARFCRAAVEQSPQRSAESP